MTDPSHTWNITLRANGGQVDGDDCMAIQTRLPAEVLGLVTVQGGLLVCLMTVEGPGTLSGALRVAKAHFLAARREAGVADDAPVVSAAVARSDQPDPGAEWPPLITAGGLADLAGLRVQWVRELMKRKDAPDPVPVEGTDRPVYEKEAALRYVKNRGGRRRH